MQERINVYAKSGGKDVKQITNIFNGLEKYFVLYFVNTSNQELAKQIEQAEEKYVVISDDMDDFVNFKTGLKIFNQINRRSTERVKHDDYDNMYYAFTYEQIKAVAINAITTCNLAQRCYVSLFED